MGHRNEEPEPGERSDTPVDATLPRDTEPTGIDLSRTLPTGAAFQATWKLPAWRPSSPQQVEVPHESGVRRLDLPGSAPLPNSDPKAASYHRGQTLPSLPPFESLPLTDSRRMSAAGRLGRTIRMAIGLPPAPRAEEPRRAATTAAPQSRAAATAPLMAAAANLRSRDVLATSVQPVGEASDTDTVSTRPNARSTDPLGHLAPSYAHDAPVRGAVPPEPAAAHAAVQPESQVLARPARHAAVASPEPHPHHERNGEATWEPPIPTKATAARGALLWTALVGAISAALVVLYFGTRSSIFDAETTSAESSTGLPEPHIVTPAPAAQDNTVLQPPEAAAQSRSVPASNATELVSTPTSAEIIFGGAVIANTPARIARPTYEADYLVRLPGYAPELVRIGPSSPQTLSITLKPLATETQH